jgi:hypothetical protein
MMITQFPLQYKTTEIACIKGPAGAPGYDRVDALAGKAAEMAAWSPTTSLAHLKLRVPEKFRESKEIWHKDRRHHGSEEIAPRPPKKSCVDGARNAQVRPATGVLQFT